MRFRLLERVVLALALISCGCTKRVDTAASVVAETRGTEQAEAVTTTMVDDQPDRVTTVVEEYAGEPIPGPSTDAPPRLTKRTVTVAEHGAVETVVRTEAHANVVQATDTRATATTHTDSAPAPLLPFLFGKLWLPLAVAGLAAVGLWKRTWLAGLFR